MCVFFWGGGEGKGIKRWTSFESVVDKSICDMKVKHETFLVISEVFHGVFSVVVGSICRYLPVKDIFSKRFPWLQVCRAPCTVH